MRSYGQYCAAARALDVVGDRWSLLLVRELLLRDCRFTDLRHGLPGVATNLLTERLRHLEDHGVLERIEAPPPVAATLYRLTPRGRALQPVLDALFRWGLPEMLRGAAGDAARGHWIASAVPMLYAGADLADLEPLTVRIESGGERLALRAGGDGIEVGLDGADDADAVLRGEPDAVLAALAGHGPALARVELEGDRGRLAALTARATAGA